MSNSIKSLLAEYYNNPWYCYRSIYKYTACGPAMGFRIRHVSEQYKEGKWFFCSDLPAYSGDRLIIDAVHVSSIVEGVDWGVEGYTLEGEFTEDEFYEVVEKVNREADEIWKMTHGCEECGPEDPYYGDHIAINPECKKCEGYGQII